ncbi:MAG: hypothetical protein WA761_00895 [Thermoplasmata archaeon]
MEYVILRAVHPSWLVLQLPREVADLIQYQAGEDRDLHPPGRGIAFLARGPGTVRVIPSFRARDVLGVETLRNRFLAVARTNERLLINLPATVTRHLGIKVTTKAPSGTRSTDDGLIWFLPAPEYYEYRARERTKKAWNGPSTGGFAHVYLAKSLLPFPRELSDLENRIELEEWRPRLDAFPRVVRGRRAAISPGSRLSE